MGRQAIGWHHVEADAWEQHHLCRFGLCIACGEGFEHADFTRAKLNAADLSSATLVGANLTGTHLEKIFYDATTQWPQGFTPPPSRPDKVNI